VTLLEGDAPYVVIGAFLVAWCVLERIVFWGATS
jgi:hypothetical protein